KGGSLAAPRFSDRFADVGARRTRDPGRRGGGSRRDAAALAHHQPDKPGCLPASCLILPSLQNHHLGPWVIAAPVVGPLVIGLMARYGFEKNPGPRATEGVHADPA